MQKQIENVSDVNTFLDNLDSKCTTQPKKNKNDTNKYDEELNSFLHSISEYYLQKDDLLTAKNKLEQIYDNNEFRHKYSQITSYLLDLISIDYGMEQLEFISQNIVDIYNIADRNNSSILKLLDHIHLEKARILNIQAFKQEYNKTKELLEKNQRASNRIMALKTDVEKLNDEVKSSRREYITILGVFASIIFAFVAGLTFTNSVLSNIHQASIYRLSFIVCLIGLFITNILHYLYKFIKDIHFNNYTDKCKYEKNKFCDSYICKFNTFIAGIILCIFIVSVFETEIKYLKQIILSKVNIQTPTKDDNQSHMDSIIH